MYGYSDEEYDASRDSWGDGGDESPGADGSYDGDGYDAPGADGYDDGESDAPVADRYEDSAPAPDESEEEYNAQGGPDEHAPPTPPDLGGWKQVAGYQQPDSSGTYQETYKSSRVDRQTGGYQRETAKREASTGQVFKERGSGRMGYKDEVRNTSTLRVGDKRGYDEYQIEERYRRVRFQGSSEHNNYVCGGGSSSSKR